MLASVFGGPEKRRFLSEPAGQEVAKTPTGEVVKLSPSLFDAMFSKRKAH